jgi:hypothetical protein
LNIEETDWEKRDRNNRKGKNELPSLDFKDAALPGFQFHTTRQHKINLIHTERPHRTTYDDDKFRN